MEQSHFEDLIHLEDTYWWHVAKRRLATRLLQSRFPAPGRLVEGGVGSARNLLEFRDLGYEVTGFDVMPEVVEHARQRGLSDVRRHDLSEPWPLAPDSVRAVVLLDVLEHVDNPVQVLRNVSRILQPGGGIVLTVPAYPLLYSSWDERLGHRRRYTSRVLRAQATEAGLKVERITHWNSFTLPAACLVRGMDRVLGRDAGSQFPRVSPVVNSALLGCAALERGWLTRIGVPFGLSIVGVFSK